jgi:cytochrome c-type biogenesis protein CcmE
MTTGTRFAIGGAIIAAATSYVAYLGAATSWQYYVTVDECAADASSLLGRPLRVNGRIASQSLQINPERNQARFILQGAEQAIETTCVGPLPDNLAEDLDVVVEGRLESASVLRGRKVLTRCASKYRTKELPRSAAAAQASREETAR